MSAMDGPEVSVDQLADAWEAALSGGELGAFMALCAPDLHYEDPITPVPLQGVPALSGTSNDCGGRSPT
jgi:hypothetical protein